MAEYKFKVEGNTVVMSFEAPKGAPPDFIKRCFEAAAETFTETAGYWRECGSDVCKNRFEAVKSDQRYCSKKCMQTMSQRRWRAKVAA